MLDSTLTVLFNIRAYCYADGLHGHALVSGTLSMLGDHGQSAQHYTGETGVSKGYKSSGGDSQAKQKNKTKPGVVAHIYFWEAKIG